jgi:hypothetical protein
MLKMSDTPSIPAASQIRVQEDYWPQGATSHKPISIVQAPKNTSHEEKGYDAKELPPETLYHFF